jgi:hypothetical protein
MGEVRHIKETDLGSKSVIEKVETKKLNVESNKNFIDRRQAKASLFPSPRTNMSVYSNRQFAVTKTQRQSTFPVIVKSGSVEQNKTQKLFVKDRR